MDTLKKLLKSVKNKYATARRSSPFGPLMTWRGGGGILTKDQDQKSDETSPFSRLAYENNFLMTLSHLMCHF